MKNDMPDILLLGFACVALLVFYKLFTAQSASSNASTLAQEELQLEAQAQQNASAQAAAQNPWIAAPAAIGSLGSVISSFSNLFSSDSSD